MREMCARKARAPRNDGWENALTGLGTPTLDKRLASVIGTSAALTQRELEDLYAGDGLARRICELPANEQTRKWIKVNADEDVGKLTLQALQTLGAQDAVTEALTWARLYGGAVVLLGIDDGVDPAKPINEKAIKSLSWLTVLNRYELEVATRNTDPFAPGYGQPELYRIAATSGQNQQQVGRTFHASRCIRFDGVRTPRARRDVSDGWCDSVFAAIYDTLRDTRGAYDGGAALLHDFSQAVYKVKGLASIIGSNQSGALTTRMQIIDVCRSILRAVVIDADGEDFTRQSTNVAGFPDMLDRMQQLLSAVTEIPVTLLMGRSPAGLNATGESDIRLFYDAVQSKQENQLRPKLERLLKLLFLAKGGPTGGREPAEWSFAFNPLWQLDSVQLADVRNKQAQTDQIYLTNGVVHPEEVRQSRFGGDDYSSETVLDDELDATDDIAADDGASDEVGTGDENGGSDE